MDQKSGVKMIKLEMSTDLNDSSKITNDIYESYKEHQSVLSIKDMVSTSNLNNLWFQKPAPQQ